MDIKKKPFVSWIISTYKSDNSPFGDLARDIIQDKNENKWFKTSYKALKLRIDSIGCSNVSKIVDELNVLYESEKTN
jgi:hypothetical protein